MTDPYSSQTPQPAAPLTEADDRQWASFAHLGGILGILPSLIIWLVFKDRGNFSNVEGKEALNFQITAAIAQVAIQVIAAVLGVITFGIGFLLSGLAWVVIILSIVFSIIAFTKAKDGISYRYPFAVRLIK